VLDNFGAGIVSGKE
jgi:hypothetical protein